MQKLFIFYILIILNNDLHSQQKKTTKDIQSSKTESFSIEGRINGYKQKDDNSFITFRTYNFYGRIKDTSLYINPDGSFKGILFQPFESDMAVMYKNGYLDLYYIPGEKLSIEINVTRWDNSDNKIASLSVKGKSAEMIKLIAEFRQVLKNHDFKTEVPWQDSTASDEAAAIVRIERMREELFILSEYIKRNNIVNKKFKDWAVNELIYQAGADITFTSFTSQRKRSLTIDQLIKVLKDIKIENNSALHNSAYYKFLYFLQGDFQIIVNTNAAFKEAIKSNGYNYLSLYLDQIDQYSYGLAKQLMYFDCYIQNQRNAGPYYLRFDTSIANNSLRRFFIEKTNQGTLTFASFNIIDRLKLSKSDSETKHSLIEIFESRTDRYLFLDFWGSWCGPCMREMPLYSELIKTFNNKNLSFLFLAVDTEEQNALKIKQKYGIEADFLVLNDNETKVLNNVLQFSSYPSHFLINPQSVVIENSYSILKGPDSLNQSVIEKLSKQISKNN